MKQKKFGYGLEMKKTIDDDYQIPGQMNIYEYLESLKPVPVKIMGIMDDAYCPKCGYCFWETRELDCECCPKCGLKVDWEPWHRANDGEKNEE